MAISKALMKVGKKALTEGSEEAIEKATKVITKATKKATTKATEKAVEKALTKSATRGLHGAGISSLAKGSGSTLDGILGRSSGLVLPEPKITPITLAENTAKYFPGEDISTIGGMINKFTGSNLDTIYKNGGLSKKSYNTLKAGAEEAADLANSALDAVGISSKSQLPKLNREQYYYDTIGKVGKKGNGNLTSRDVPEYMQSHLSNPKDTREAFVRGGNDEILRELFNDNESSLSDLYSRYEELAQGPNSNAIYTPDNIDMGVGLMGKEGKMAEQDFADRLFRGKKDINVTKSSSGAKNIKVSSPKTTSGVGDAVAETATTTNPDLADEIAELKAQVSSAGGGMRGGGTPTATASPDYGGLGGSGFNVRLKEGKTTNIQLGDSATGSTRQQRAVRKLDDMTAKGMNASAKQYRGLVGKSGSIDGYYKSVAERIRAEKIDQANVAEKAQAALSLREDIKQQGLQYAEANGVTMDLSNIDNTIGLSATQKRKLAELGLGLDDMLGGNSVVTPTQAEDIYKTLRDYAYNWSDSKDALTKMAGNACEKEAKAVRDIIDNTMDNINVDYKTSLVEDAAKNGEDPAYLRKLAGKPDFKFSDLRKDQSDWIAINDLAGNKIKEGPTLNVFGVDTGAPNPFTAGADKIKEKIYERQAYGAGGAGGSGAENNINFTSPAGGGSGTLGNLLGKAKTAGLVGAGVIGGLALGGGGGGGSDVGEFASLGGAMMPEEEVEIDPYQTLTIGGYTYDQLEAGYTAALMAGDTDAANLIANMIGMLDDKAKRYSDANSSSSSSSGIASKQRAALNVLSGLMQNYQAQGPIGGSLTQLLNVITGGAYNPAVSAYDSGSRGALGTIIKALGDTGALSEGDQTRALELLPKTTDSEEAAKYKYQQLIQILQGAGAQ